jgi:hypothetical protein
MRRVHCALKRGLETGLALFVSESIIFSGHLMQPHYRYTEKGKHRLHERLSNFSILVAAFAISTTYLQFGAAKMNEGDFAALDCIQLPLSVRIPLHGPVEAAMIGRRPDMIQFGIYPAVETKIPVLPANEKTLLPVMLNLAGPVFVEYYEAYRQWLYTKFGHPNSWPETWRFARVVRNCFSHGGLIRIDKKDPPVEWRGLSYSSADDGRGVLGTDLAIGDILVLLFEMDDALNDAGCPLVTP